MLAAIGLVGASSPAVAQSCTAGTESDFDGDGKFDLAIGDPDATVAGKLRAGRVHVAYGSGAAVTIDADDIPNNENGAGERFGFSMDTVDWNGDGCTDLFIGAPYEAWASGMAETGIVVFIPGSPTGLDTALAKNWSQASFDGDTGVDTNHPGDRFGWDIAAGLDTAGDPFIVVGVPGESTTTTEGVVLNHGGNVFYARPGNAIDFNQNSAGFADSFEDGDMFGYSVAASESGFVVGVPGEDANYSDHTIHDAGTMFLMAHSDASTVPAPIAAWGQGNTTISGEFEDGDMYGYSLDMVDYISTGGGAAKMMIAIGASGEDTSAGLSSVVWSPGSGFTEYKTISQDGDGAAADAAEPGDMFGAAVAMVNRTPGQNTGVNTLLMTVGVPGEDDEATGLFDVGEAQLFSMTEDQAQENNPVRPRLPAEKFTPADGAGIGQVLYANKQYLFVSATGATGPAVYRIPWDNLVAGAAAAVTSYTPATFGLTNADVVSFGASLA
ncbi:VCBS repeat-containing protein [Glycomyces mayteni]|uniref:VCBS repeat-containing protein n=1 Tax=Glycomyces mayteni TaxID=543887 RepID=A0ABW2D7J9_9ACTN